MRPLSPFPWDLLERVSWSFVGGFAAGAGLDVVTIGALGWQAWLTTGVLAGIVSVLKGFGAKFIGDSNSASTSTKVPAVVPEVPPERIP